METKYIKLRRGDRGVMVINGLAAPGDVVEVTHKQVTRREVIDKVVSRQGNHTICSILPPACAECGRSGPRVRLEDAVDRDGDTKPCCQRCRRLPQWERRFGDSLPGA